MSEKILRLVALSDGPDGPIERGAIDGPELTLSVTVDGELLVANGLSGFFGGGALQYGWEDLVPDYRLGETVRLEVRIVDSDE
ncbi:hypothetical protein SEA_RASPUTIA_31 [Microbacterium phage Rasputia]|nr:hypothetical protein SEA_RASPUTIA_31 [Microbacterium phage Rasputia]